MTSDKSVEVRRIRALVAQLIGAGGDHVMIAELACLEEGCQPIETVITIMGSKNQSFKIAKRMKDVSMDDVKDALRGEEPHGH